ncbi:MAG TPA: HD-GYP domain-containing protein [Sporosarcina sp.]|nr:HD-GYP domain-containing protein [Sporosarcina sp.]
MRKKKFHEIHSGLPTPLLRLGYAEVRLLGRWDGLSHALFSLHKGRTFWVLYEHNDDIVETYTLLDGSVEMEYEGKVRMLEVGETIDASEYSNILTFKGITNTELLIKMTTTHFEPGFFETILLQEEADEIESVDGYTFMHSNRIKDYSIEVWKKLGLPKEKLSILRWGAYFHDIGKRVVPLEILNKPGPLTPEEHEIMKAHTVKGAELMRNHEVKWLKDAAFIVEQHHERFDGNGYPYGLKGDEISIEAAIVSVVDAFDAMTTDRVYRKSLSISDAIQELIDGKGEQFHPRVVDAFLEVLQSESYKWK